MMLPLPTVSNIDVTRERLADVERDAARPLPDIAATVGKAVQTGQAVVEMGEQDRKRQEADWFQKEYVDKGWEGAEKLWQETGADPTMNPAYWRTAVGDAPAKYFEAIGKKVEENAAKTALSEYEKLVASGNATPEELAAAEIKAGKTAGKGYEAVKAVADRGQRAKIEADKIAGREEVAKIRAAATKESARLRSEASKLTGDDKTQVEYFLKTKDDLEKQIQDIYAGYGYDSKTRSFSLSPEDKETIASLSRQRDNAVSQANILIRKGAKPGGDAQDSPPADTPPKAYPKAKKGKDGGWYIPDPARPRKYLKVG